MEIDDAAGPDRNIGVITPKVIGIGPRRYRTRFQAGHGGNATATTTQVPIDDPVQSELAWADDGTLAEGIEQRSDGRFGATVTVPSAFMGKLIGKKGEGKRRIEKETKTVVTVPRRGAGEGVDIVGGTADGVESARTRIEMLVASAVKSAGISHFVSIQLAGPDFATMLLTFKEQALDLGVRYLYPPVLPRPLHCPRAPSCTVSYAPACRPWSAFCTFHRHPCQFFSISIFISCPPCRCR